MKKIFAFLLIATFIIPKSSFAAKDVITLNEKINSLLSEIETMEFLAKPQNLPKLSTDEKKRVIKNGVAWLQNSQESNGHFAYEYLPFDDTYRDDDNIVRQAGALFQLGEVARRDTGNVYDVSDNLKDGIKYFEKLSKPGRYNGKKFRCVVNFADSTTCKLGATSLALIGIVSFVEAEPEQKKEYEKLMGDYVQYILAMKKPSAGFSNNFYVDDNSAAEEESSFFNGEALLALTRYQNLNSGNSEVGRVINETFDYFNSPKVIYDTALYLWAMAAIKDMNADAPRAEYSTYAKRYTDWRKGPLATKRSSDHNTCAYIEGVASAYSIMENSLSPNEAKYYKEEIDFWLAKSALLQINQNDLVKYDSKTATFVRAPKPRLALGGFLTGHDELTQRIDFTQHCLSSYIQTLVDIEGETF